MKFSLKNYFSFFSHPAHGSGFSAWFRTLAKNKFSIDPIFIPKAIAISITIVLATPFRLYESLKYKRKIEQVKLQPPLFIIGHPRSGTTFLHYLMSKDPQFTFCSTVQAMVPHLFLSGSKIFPALLSRALPSKRPMDNLKMGANLPKEEEFAMASIGAESMVAGYFFPKRFVKNFRSNVVFENDDIEAESTWKRNFDFFLRKISFASPGKSLLLKSPGNTGRIKQILDLYPDAKFIHIYRNPYEVYSSNLHLYKKLLPLLSLQRIKLDKVESFVIESYSLLMKKYFKERSLIAKNNLIEVQYEKFSSDPLSGLEQIYNQLQLSNINNVKRIYEEELKSYDDYKKNVFNLSEKDKKTVSINWRFAFEELEYPI